MHLDSTGFCFVFEQNIGKYSNSTSIFTQAAYRKRTNISRVMILWYLLKAPVGNFRIQMWKAFSFSACRSFNTIIEIAHTRCEWCGENDFFFWTLRRVRICSFYQTRLIVLWKHVMKSFSVLSRDFWCNAIKDLILLSFHLKGLCNYAKRLIFVEQGDY